MDLIFTEKNYDYKSESHVLVLLKLTHIDNTRLAVYLHSVKSGQTHTHTHTSFLCLRQMCLLINKDVQKKKSANALFPV